LSAKDWLYVLNFRPCLGGVSFQGKDAEFVASESALGFIGNTRILEYYVSLRSCLLVYRRNDIISFVPYLPHRLCRNFGLDQHLPASLNIEPCYSLEFVGQCWAEYKRYATDSRFCIPNISRVGSVSHRYLRWIGAHFDAFFSSLIGIGKITPSRERQKSYHAGTSVARIWRDKCVPPKIYKKSKGEVSSDPCAGFAPEDAAQREYMEYYVFHYRHQKWSDKSIRLMFSDDAHRRYAIHILNRQEDMIREALLHKIVCSKDSSSNFEGSGMDVFLSSQISLLEQGEDLLSSSLRSKASSSWFLSFFF
jgi:hypothetical protein